MDSSSNVIKVKFGETLRRFYASINDEKLDLDIVMLKEKIRSLFSFGSDVEFSLTYVDEDSDVVTLADDHDLHDVVRQSLDPLRITVTLINSSNAGVPSGMSEPLRSLPNQLPFQTVNTGVSDVWKYVPEPRNPDAELLEKIEKMKAMYSSQNSDSKASSSTGGAPNVDYESEILKYVPEPLRKFITKLPIDLAAKKSSEILKSSSEFAEKLEKMKVYMNEIPPSMASPPTGGVPNVNSESSTFKNPVNPDAGSLNSQKKKKKVTEGVKFNDNHPRGVDLNDPYFDYELFQAPVNVTEGSTGKNKDTTDGVEKKKGPCSSEKEKGSFNEPLSNPDDMAASLLLHQMKKYSQDQVADESKKATNDYWSHSGWAQFSNASNQCPFLGMPLQNDSESQGHHRHFRGPQWKRYGLDNNNNGMVNIFHRGVRCDGCGVHPITGPRFKSKVKDDYDLCGVCFTGMGNATDYIRIDRPTSGFRHHTPFKGFYDHHSLRIPPPTLPHAMRAPGSKLPRSKLDSRFILDVNVLDGTIMAPFTAFTKIWRMRNNGTVSWPHGSQLQWIGGDLLSTSRSVHVEIPMDGLPADKELDVAVDFTAPELPGRYVSYWRMASPSGQKFGQRVWVLIQVDASMKDLGETSINLNLPPVTRNPDVADEDRLMESGNNFIKVNNSEGTSVDFQPKKDQEMNFPINDSLIIDNGGMASFSAPPETASSSVFKSTELENALASVSSGFYPTKLESNIDHLEPISYPTVDFSVMPPEMVSAPPSPPIVAVPVAQSPSGSGSRAVSDDQEQALVKDLADMGFKQVELNKEILRMNNYDLEKSIDDLCGVTEWDPMLEELQEMGFADNEANRRLLKKNNGSIKRAVIDLINGERA